MLDDNHERGACDQRESGACAERNGGAERRPQHAEHDARGERAQAEDRVVDTKRQAPARDRREIGNKRLLCPLGETEVEAVDQKPATGVLAMNSRRQTRHTPRRRPASRRDHRAPPDTIGPAAATTDTDALTT